MKIFKSIQTMLTTLIISIMFSSVATAQTTILVIDQQRVLHTSDVGKHIQRQLKSIGTQMESEIKSQVTPLTSERDKLVKELKNMSVDALKSRPDLQQRAKSLQTKGAKSQLDAQYKQRELQITEQKALAKVNKKLETILKAIVAERKADVIVDRSMVIYSAPSADITATVISRLNSQMRTVSVIRERLPRKAKMAKKKTK